MPGTTLQRVFLACAALASGPVVSAENAPQTYPAKPVRIVVGFTAGGSTDVIARLVAQRLSGNMGQSIIVDNRPGATGAIADELVAKAPADGYTLLINSGSSAITAVLRKLPYDFKRDLTPVSLVATVPFVIIVHPSLPVRNVKELIEFARARPGKLSCGVSGTAGAHHLASELFNQMAKVSIVPVPFKGGADNVIATASGQIELSYATLTAALPLLQAERLRPLAVTSIKRSSLLPSVPSLDEAGLTGYDRPNWNGMLGPAGMPKAIVTRLGAELEKELNTRQAQEAFASQGLEVQTSTPEHFAAFIQRQIAENAKLVKLIGVKVD